MAHSGPAIYLDHAASAPLLPAARAAMVAALELTGNPSSVHARGRALRERIEAARDAVAAAAGAERAQVVFTGSATEAITQAIVGGVATFGLSRVIVGATEHRAVLAAAGASGAAVTVVPVDAGGRLDLDALAAALDGPPALVAVQAANNETGTIQPLAEIEALVGPGPHLLLVDAVQIFGRRPLDFATRAPDMVAVSAHKIGGPAGVGALLVKGHCDGVRLIPGGGQEQGRRGGTESAALIAGFGAAADAFPAAWAAAGVPGLTERLEAGIRAACPDVAVFGADRLDGTVCFAVPGLSSAVAMMALDLDGVAVSSGSACSSGKVGRSHVLAAMGVVLELADCALRASLGWSSTEDDVSGFLAAFGQLLDRHRARAA